MRGAVPPRHRRGPFRLRPRWRRALLIGAVAAAAVGLTLVATQALRRSADNGALRTVKFTITPGQLAKGDFQNIDTGVFISGDGKHIAYIENTSRQLWVRDLDQEQAHPVPGATGVYEAFWSPDDQSIGYATGPRCSAFTPCDLVRIPVQGGTPVIITRVDGFRRAAWSKDSETIVYCDYTGIYTVPARGGSPTRISQNPPLIDEEGHPHTEHPSFLDLPGGRRAFLFQGREAGRPGHGIYVQIMGEQRPRLITWTSSTNPYPAYSPTGHIIYTDGNYDTAAIWALPFSLATLQPAGKAFPIAQHGSSPRVSRTGTLVYSDVPTNHLQLGWCDRSGTTLSTIGDPLRQQGPSLSPDGRKLAVQSAENEPDLWVYDLDRGIKTRFTSDSTFHAHAAWTPSGDEITYATLRNGTLDIASKPSGGAGEAKLLVGTPLDEDFPNWSPNRRFLIYAARSNAVKSHLLYRERRPDGTLGDPAVFLQAAFQATDPRFSPDGRFVAYTSDESGKNEVYVRDFPNGKNQWQISLNGGAAPRWRRDGKEIFYVAQNKLMAVAIATGSVLSPGVPVVLFQKPFLGTGYEVAADGKRFIVPERPAEPPLSIHVVHNWFEEFRGK